MRVGITGSRYGWTPEQEGQFIDLACEGGWTEFHFGGCTGVDDEALWLLIECGGGGVLHCHPATMNPTWDAQWVVGYSPDVIETLGIVMHPPKHPLARNKDIVHSVDVLLAAPAPGSRGTLFTMEYAKKRGVKVIEL